jgi:hypothetical protein
MSKRKLETIKKKRVVTEKQRANLRPAKKGEVRNPEGGRTHNPIMRALAKVTKDSFADVLTIAFQSTETELQDLIFDPEATALKKLIARAMLQALEEVNYGFVERIADRLIGRIEDNININSKSSALLGTVDLVKLRKTMHDLKNDV